MRYFFAAIALSPVAIFVVWLNITSLPERRRRKALPPEERERLEREEAIWFQENSF
jgi:hypothetical protein